MWGMAHFGLVVNAFDKAYREAILEYTKHRMTGRERKVFQSLLQRSGNGEGQLGSGVVSIERVIDQFRNVDPEGWMVYKSAFVEDYIDKLSNQRDQVCLCQIDNSTESGLVVCCGISLPLYKSFVMAYVPTSLECIKMAQTPASESRGLLAFVSNPATVDEDGGDNDARDISVQYEQRKRVLQQVSGCDSKGWLSCKQSFIRNELACEALLPMQSARFESVVGSAVDAVLQNVRREVHSEICRHLPFSMHAGTREGLSALENIQ